MGAVTAVRGAVLSSSGSAGGYRLGSVKVALPAARKPQERANAAGMTNDMPRRFPGLSRASWWQANTAPVQGGIPRLLDVTLPTEKVVPHEGVDTVVPEILGHLQPQLSFRLTLVRLRSRWRWVA